MLFMRQATEIECVRYMCKMRRLDIPSEGEVVHLSPCCVPRPFSSSYLTLIIEAWG